MDVRVKLVILRKTVAELFDSLQAAPVLRTFLQYLVAFRSPSYLADLWGRLPDKRIKFRIPRLNRYGEIPPKPSEAAFSAVFRTSINVDRK